MNLRDELLGDVGCCCDEGPLLAGAFGELPNASALEALQASFDAELAKLKGKTGTAVVLERTRLTNEWKRALAAKDGDRLSTALTSLQDLNAQLERGEAVRSPLATTPDDVITIPASSSKSSSNTSAILVGAAALLGGLLLFGNKPEPRREPELRSNPSRRRGRIRRRRRRL